jgi:hypothetical protein
MLHLFLKSITVVVHPMYYMQANGGENSFNKRRIPPFPLSPVDIRRYVIRRLAQTKPIKNIFVPKPQDQPKNLSWTFYVKKSPH